jgi:hypothetical protein
MAIISGMEAAKVDDVKPFELPVDALAEGVKVRQGRYDAAKDLNAKGAAALMFDVRDREEDYAERQKVIDEYNARINELSDSVGGDWSLLDNSQIQAEAIKSAQDKRVGHLKMAKKQADEYEKIAKEIEKEHGFVERFGEDANTQALYDENGNLRDLEKWSLQSKRDHVLAAHNYYKDVGTTLRSKFEMIHSTDPEYNKLPPEKKEQLWYDFWVNKHTDKETNIFQINQIKDFLVNDYKATEAGKQYYNILIRDAMKAGQPAELARKYADDTIFTLVQQIGASKYIDKETVKATMQTNTKPVEPSYGGSNPRGTGKGKGGDDDEKKVYEMPENDRTNSEVTDEGYTYEKATAYDQARSITDKNFNIQTLPKNFAYGSVLNVYASADAGVLVPHSTDDSRGGVAKNVPGTIYQFGDGVLSNLKDGKKGGNLAAVRIGEGTPTAFITSNLSGVFGGNYDKNYIDYLNKQTEKYNADPDIYGIIAFNKDDMNTAVDLMIEDKLKDDKNYASLKDDKLKEAHREKLKSQLLGSFIGTDGDIAPAYKAKYDEKKGYATYSMRDEYSYIAKALDLEEAKIAKMPDGEAKQARGRYLDARRKNFNDKIGDSESKLKLLNTTMHDVYNDKDGKFNFTDEELGFIKNMEGLRAHTKSLQLSADNLLLLDRTIAKTVQMDDKEYNELINIHSKDPQTLLNRSSANDAKIIAIGNALNTHYWSGSFRLGSQIDDIKDPLYKDLKSNIVNFGEKFLQGSVNIEELNSIPKNLTLHYRASASLKGGNADDYYELDKLSTYMLLKSGFQIEPDPDVPDGFIINGGQGGYEFSDVASHLKRFKEANFVEDENGNLSMKPGIDFIKINEEYSQNLKTELAKSKCTPKYKQYLALSLESKQVTTTTYYGNRFQFAPTTEGKQMQASVAQQAKSEFKASIQTGVFASQLVWKRVVYDNKGIPEKVDLNGDEIKTALKTLNLKYDAKGALIMDGAANSLQDMINKAEHVYIRPDYNNDVSENGDGTYSGSFVNADIQLSYIDQKTGATTSIWVEIPMTNISQEMALMIGMDNVTVEYGQQIAASRTKSHNTMIELTVPSTKHTANPITKQYQVLNFDTNIAGVVHKRGSIVSLNNYQQGVPLSEQYEQLKLGDFTVYANEDALIKAFQAENQKGDEKLKFALTKINTYEEKYGDLARENPAKFEATFRRLEGENAWKAYEKAGSFQGMKATAAKMIASNSYSENPNKIPGTETSGGERALSHNPITNTKSIINTRTGQVMTKEEANNATTVELKHWIGQAKQSAGNTNNLKEVAQTIEDNINRTKDTKHADGQLYMFPENSETHLKVGNKDVKVAGKGEDPSKGSFYSLYETDQALDPMELQNAPAGTTKAKKPIAIAKGGAVNRIHKDADAAFQQLFSHIDLKKDLYGMPLEVSSIARSVNNNLAQYTQDLGAFTNSSHMYGKAIDISTMRLGNTPEQSSGLAFVRWAEANRNLLAEYGIYVLKHAVTGGDDHVHLEYVGKGDSRAGTIEIE